MLGICKEELGGSEYLKQLHNIIKGTAPDLDLKLEKAVQDTVLESIKEELVNSAHDCSEGGLAVALAECCLSNKDKMTGAIIDNLAFDLTTDAVLFGESQSRIIVSCGEESVDKIRIIAEKYKAPFRVIGKTGGKELKVLNGENELINLSLKKLHKEWTQSLRRQIDSSC